MVPDACQVPTDKNEKNKDKDSVENKEEGHGT